ncbi:MAG: RNA-binding transcriptional accessory protein [Planctomycetaceae bacterium]|nr:RNA-binding transcriptional accessory protein [Planctomycetaceae bacterium]
MQSLARSLSQLAQELGLKVPQLQAALELLDAGNTVPFITRYRKEQTGGMDEEQIRAVQAAAEAARQLSQRAETILRSIEQQGQLTPALRAEIEQADSLKRLEDLYLPFKPRRRSRADAARELGLGPLAEEIWNRKLGTASVTTRVRQLIGTHEALDAEDKVYQGLNDILAERIAEQAVVREIVREVAGRSACIQARLVAKSEQAATFRDYDGFEQSTGKLPPHRTLALNRGEAEKALRVKVSWDEERALDRCGRFLTLQQHPAAELMQRALADGIGRLVNPSIEREIRRDLTEAAQRHAIETFSRNLRSLLLQPPLSRTRIVAIDPGFRTGCKVAALDEQGELLETDVLYLTGPPEKLAAIRRRLAEFIRKHQSEVIALGNGTGCREAEQLIAEMIQEEKLSCRYAIVNEAGASIYSASTAGREEFPDLDATVRGTISIGRRLQDPLSELVKIEPQHVGVGMYQHDIDEKALQASLDTVVESCVNFVGVDLNNASGALLQYVSGLNPGLSKKIVAYRAKHGLFHSRQELLKVPGIGAATFLQAAGFLRISSSEEPLDNTWIHPESYPLTRSLLQQCGLSPEMLTTEAGGARSFRQQLEQVQADEVARQLEADAFTIRHILDSLARPGRDPREDQAGPVFRSQILSLDDLEVGMELTGVVRNVVDFGAFVDVGLKDSGLVHISQMSREFIKSPFEAVSVGDAVTVWVLQIDRERRRIGLTMLKERVEQLIARN